MARTGRKRAQGPYLFGMAGPLLVLMSAVAPGAPFQRVAIDQQPDGSPGNEATALAGRRADDEALVVRGRVIDPDGKPVAGAQLLLNIPSEDLGERRRLGRSGQDGQFTVSISRTAFEPAIFGIQTFVHIAATARGFGPAWNAIDPTKPIGPITLQLRRDDVAIAGRITDPEQKPIPGVTVEISDIADVGPDEVKALRGKAGQMKAEDVAGTGPAITFATGRDPFLAVKTDQDGRFRLTGVGRDRVVTAIVRGGGVEVDSITLTTIAARDEPVAESRDDRATDAPETSSHSLVLRHGHVYEGTVRDHDTGRPIAGTEVAALFGSQVATATSDAEGRYRLEGVPGGRQILVTISVEGLPYISRFALIEAMSGRKPEQMDIALKRGVWVKGRITNATTGKPVKATVWYYSARGNPNLKECADAPFVQARRPPSLVTETARDGRFRTAVIPGKGLLVVQAHAADYAIVDPIDPKLGEQYLYLLNSPSTLVAHALLPFEAPADKDVVLPDTRLEPGVVQRIRLLDTDGNAVVGAIVATLNLHWSNAVEQPFPSDEVTYRSSTPGKTETLLFIHEERRIGGAVVLTGDEPDAVKVVLRPTGTVTGRLVDQQGKPRAGVMIRTDANVISRGRPGSLYRFDSVKTGVDGRFRLQHLVGGVSYTSDVLVEDNATGHLVSEGDLKEPEWTLKVGETRDWGDVQVTKP